MYSSFALYLKKPDIRLCKTIIRKNTYIIEWQYGVLWLEVQTVAELQSPVLCILVSQLPPCLSENASAQIFPKEVGGQLPPSRIFLAGVLGSGGSYESHMEKWGSDGEVRV